MNYTSGLTEDDPFKPEEHFQFMDFDRTLRRVDRMGGAYLDAKIRGLTEAEAFWLALDAGFPDLAANVDTSVELFYDDFRDKMVDKAGTDVAYVVGIPLRPVSTKLSLHSFERVCMFPGPLLETATTVPVIPKRQLKPGAPKNSSPDDPDAWEVVKDRRGRPAMIRAPKRSIPYRKFFDSRRRLAIALQYLRIEQADPDAWASADLMLIDDLSNERLFDPFEDKTIMVIAITDHRRHHRVKKLMLYTDSNKFHNERRRLRDAGVAYFTETFLCRVAEKDGKRYYVFVEGRYKRKRATNFKLERGRHLTDRRGWKYVIVAVQENDHIRAGTYRDARAFATWTKKKLWVNELVEGVDDSDVNRNSHPDYRDVKVVGRVQAWHEVRSQTVDRVFVSAQCEQLVLGLKDHMNTLTSTDGLNHDVYRGIQIVDHISRKWFPIAIYRVDWPSFPKPGEPEDRSHSKRLIKQELVHWWTTMQSVLARVDL